MNKIIITKGSQFKTFTPFRYEGISGANENLDTQGQWQICLAVMEEYNDK